MDSLRTPDQFKTTPALTVMGLIGLILAYALISWAIDSGSLWLYGLSFITMILSLRLLGRAIRQFIRK